MRLGIMQPYFFPYIGYFDVILKSDRWIVFDVVKYQPKTWMNRNRVLEPNKGEQYISVPVDRSSGRMLSDVSVQDPSEAYRRILNQLLAYRNVAPYYRDVCGLVEEAFSLGAPFLLRDLNVRSLAVTCNRLGIQFDPLVCSRLDLDFSRVGHAGQWALEICDQLGATAYLNPSGGKALFRVEEWSERGIDLRFTRPPDFRYATVPSLPFVPNLSILDCMMWMPPDEIRGYLESLPIDDA